MNWNAFVEGFKTFWNQPIPIIGFTIGTVILGALFIISRTSIGKKALNKLKKLYEELTKKLLKAEADLIESNNRFKRLYEESKKQLEEFNEVIDRLNELKNQEIQKLTNKYELKLINYKNQLLKQDELIKVICENSINKNIKDAYEKYIPEELDLPINEIKTKIEEKVKSEYEDRLKALEELVYGERKETTND